MPSISPNLVVSRDGFVFDRSTGFTYTANPAGVMLLEGLLNHAATTEVIHRLETRFHLDHRTAEIDVQDFLEQLRSLGLLAAPTGGDDAKV